QAGREAPDELHAGPMIEAIKRLCATKMRALADEALKTLPLVPVESEGRWLRPVLIRDWLPPSWEEERAPAYTSMVRHLRQALGGRADWLRREIVEPGGPRHLLSDAIHRASALVQIGAPLPLPAPQARDGVRDGARDESPDATTAWMALHPVALRPALARLAA